MSNIFTVEELVIDDSFYCYCLNTATDEKCYAKWQQYATDNPLEKKNMEEARLIVLGLHSMLQQRKSSAAPDSVSLPMATKTNYAVNSFMLGCVLYASRIAHVIIGFCITSLMVVFSMPVQLTFTQPGVHKQAPAADKYGINALKLPAGSSFQSIPALFWLNAPPYIPVKRNCSGLAGTSYTGFFNYNQFYTGKASLY